LRQPPFVDQLFSANGAVDRVASFRIPAGHFHVSLFFVVLQTSVEAAANGNKTPAAAPATPNSNSGKRRDFGSHGSLDALTSGAERESFFALLRDLGAQSSSSSSNGSSHVASRSSPERDVDNKPVGCAPSRLAELLRPNFNRGVVTNLQGTGADSLMSTVTIGGSVSLTVVQQQQQQQQNIMTRYANLAGHFRSCRRSCAVWPRSTVSFAAVKSLNSWESGSSATSATGRSVSKRPTRRLLVDHALGGSSAARTASNCRPGGLTHKGGRHAPRPT
jgi:hypothetical protein